MIRFQKKKVKAVLRMAGLSYHEITRVLHAVECGHETVEAVGQGGRTPHTERKPKEGRLVAVDETKPKAHGECCYVWASIDVDTRELLAVRASWARDILHARLFLEETLKACTNTPRFLVDGGLRYPEALRQLGLEWEHKTFGERNSVERWFRTLKERAKRFYNSFPVEKTPILKIWLFIKLFALWHNYIRPH